MKMSLDELKTRDRQLTGNNSSAIRARIGVLQVKADKYRRAKKQAEDRASRPNADEERWTTQAADLAAAAQEFDARAETLEARLEDLESDGEA